MLCSPILAGVYLPRGKQGFCLGAAFFQGGAMPPRRRDTMRTAPLQWLRDGGVGEGWVTLARGVIPGEATD